MDDIDLLAKTVRKIRKIIRKRKFLCNMDEDLFLAGALYASGVKMKSYARPLEEWHEDFGDVLWWKFPIEEPPYVGSPLDVEWPAYHTHWTPITVPEPPKGE